MVMFKIFGALLVLAVGGGAAVSAVRYEKCRLRVLDAWIDLIFYIRSQIDCYLKPIAEILSGEECARLCAELAAEDAADLQAILRASELYLDGDVKRFLESFVREIGSVYREEQIKQCDYYIAVLRDARASVAAEHPARIRLSVALCICISLGTAILLW